MTKLPSISAKAMSNEVFIQLWKSVFMKKNNVIKKVVYASSESSQILKL